MTWSGRASCAWPWPPASIPAKIVMHGNAKSDDDIRAALDAAHRLHRRRRVRRHRPDRRGWPAPAPRCCCGSAPASSRPPTRRWPPAAPASKFGVPVDQVPEAIARMRDDPLIDLQGLHAHIGSQILNLASSSRPRSRRWPRWASSTSTTSAAASACATSRRTWRRPSTSTPPGWSRPPTGTWAQDIEILVEPGRSLVAPAGLTLYRVVTMKQSGRLHVAVDGGMGDNLEHSLYGQRFTPLVVGRWDEPAVVADLVGRHCEAGDVVTPGRHAGQPADRRPDRRPGHRRLLLHHGQQLQREPAPAGDLCADGVARLAVRRETPDDLLAREVLVRATPPVPASR